MSRTIRRTRDKRRNKSGRSNFVETYIFDRVENYMDLTWESWAGMPKVKLTGKEYDKQFWRFHRDTHNSYGWSNGTYTRKRFENRLRMLNKQEIQKFWKDPDYEVILFKPFCLSWED